LLKNRADISGNNLKAAARAMNSAFPFAEVENFDHLISTINLPDPNDNHVLACAIASGAALIITFNLKDFPDRELNKFDVQALHPDAFVSRLIENQPTKGKAAFNNQVEKLKNPQLS
jgi:predicted nucleic acid-binding protein